MKNAHYHKWETSKQENNGDKPVTPGKKLYDLQDTIKLLGQENLDAIDVFKIDCEGCEWESFDSWLDPSMPDLMQILVEVHYPPIELATVFFDRLQAAGYARFHKEFNIFAHAGLTEYAFLRPFSSE